MNRTAYTIAAAFLAVMPAAGNEDTPYQPKHKHGEAVAKETNPVRRVSLCHELLERVVLDHSRRGRANAEADYVALCAEDPHGLKALSE